jgi:hypothetical protein
MLTGVPDPKDGVTSSHAISSPCTAGTEAGATQSPSSRSRASAARAAPHNCNPRLMFPNVSGASWVVNSFCRAV